jgi:hypothetical protein
MTPLSMATGQQVQAINARFLTKQTGTMPELIPARRDERRHVRP